MRVVVGCGLVSGLVGMSVGQSTSNGPLEPPVNGVRRTDPGHHVFMGVTIHTGRREAAQPGMLVFRDGKITRVSTLLEGMLAPAGAVTHDGLGLHIYPGLIDAFVEVDEPEADDRGGLMHWNAMVTPHHMAVLGPGLDEGEREALRELGFVAANFSPESGVFRGHSGVVSLGEPPTDASLAQPPVYVASSANVLSFDRTRGVPDGSAYPTSHMGAVALIRQSLIDNQWQLDAREAGDEIPFNSLDAIMSEVPLLFDLGNPLQAFSADAIGDEFERDVILVGDGVTYQHLEAIAGGGRAMVVPLRFPAEPDVSSVGMIESLDLKELMAWEQAPTNAARLLDAGIEVALTSSKVQGRGKFHANLRKAIEHGLSEDDALAALTSTPAKMLGVDDRLGSLEVGKIASFIVADGELFDEDTKILEVWIDGRRHEITKPKAEDLAGRWSYTFGMDPAYDGTLEIEIDDKGSVKLSAISNDPEVESIDARKVKLDGRRLSYLMDNPDGSGTVVGALNFAGDRLFGTVLIPGGTSMEFTGTRQQGENAEEQEGAEDAEEEDDEGLDVPESYGYPFGGYGVEELGKSQPTLFVNATIWTSGPDGILEDGWTFVEDGKVLTLGTGVAPRGRPNVRIIDCEGRHITPGLFDAHSHTGIFAGGGNEASQSCTSEVRIHDNLDPATINWYRQLAGGVTVVNTLHGSANPIGGQNAIHKVRWGARHPRDMLMEGAKPGIKFALGENVKHSNRSREYNQRYPQTRMGVETFIRDRFIAAREYAARKEAARVEGIKHQLAAARSEAVGSVIFGRPFAVPAGFRRDLELEALAEILAGDRLIHSHSYRQDEILMLCRVAEDFGFKIGSFQHVLEGYKVAEAIKEHALGASCFSDWWAYKVEVQDAIPYNGPIMHEVGVVVSYNSDSDELSRRLNTEAAKAVKYGGIDPAEALKFVTLNPAIQMGVDDRVGSLEVGKDADLVIWSGDPLSSLSVCEATWIDGIEYFSLDKDAAHRANNASERQRILAKLLTDEKPKKGDGEDYEGEDEDTDDPGWLARDRLSLEFLDNLDEDELDLRGDCGCTSEGWLHNLIHNR